MTRSPSPAPQLLGCHIHQHTLHRHTPLRVKAAARSIHPSPSATVRCVMYAGCHTRNAVHLSSASAPHSAMSTLEVHCQRFPKEMLYLLYNFILSTLHLMQSKVTQTYRYTMYVEQSAHY